jgi:hypothetical protein
VRGGVWWTSGPPTWDAAPMASRAAAPTCPNAAVLTARGLDWIADAGPREGRAEPSHRARPHRRRCACPACVQDVPARCWARQLPNDRHRARRQLQCWQRLRRLWDANRLRCSWVSLTWCAFRWMGGRTRSLWTPGRCLGWPPDLACARRRIGKPSSPPVVVRQSGRTARRRSAAVGYGELLCAASYGRRGLQWPAMKSTSHAGTARPWTRSPAVTVPAEASHLPTWRRALRFRGWRAAARPLALSNHATERP